VRRELGWSVRALGWSAVEPRGELGRCGASKRRVNSGLDLVEGGIQQR
jgi:FAD/FMN-containing dehydrogenase